LSSTVRARVQSQDLSRSAPDCHEPLHQRTRDGNAAFKRIMRMLLSEFVATVVSSPQAERTARSPVFIKTKQPVP